MVSVLLAACTCLPVSHVMADDVSESMAGLQQREDFLSALLKGTTKSLVRYNAMFRDSSLRVLQDGSDPVTSEKELQQYSAIGGFFGYETLPWFNWSVGATLYGAFPFGNNPADRKGLGGLYEGNGGQDPYLALGEAYALYRNGGHVLKAGRQEMPGYRFVSLSDIRVSPITHSGVTYENRAFGSFRFNLAYIARMKERNTWKFIGMARAARLKESTNGKQLIRGAYNPADYDANGYIGPAREMTMASAIYSSERLLLEAWNYYVDDFVNTVYLYADYEFQLPGGDFIYSLAGQYARQKNVGGQIAGDIDTHIWGVKLAASSAALSWFFSYNQVDYNEDSYDGGTIFVRWGSPQMFNSFQVQDSELAGTRSTGVGVQYDFGYAGTVPGLVMRLRYGNYNMPDRLYMTDARQDRAEANFDLRYSFGEASGFGILTAMKGLSILFRLAYDDYRTDYDFEAYRKIHGYDFSSVTKDFFDVRLYIDYRF